VSYELFQQSGESTRTKLKTETACINKPHRLRKLQHHYVARAGAHSSSQDSLTWVFIVGTYNLIELHREVTVLGLIGGITKCNQRYIKLPETEIDMQYRLIETETKVAETDLRNY
jgi:hypothetical protein